MIDLTKARVEGVELNKKFEQVFERSMYDYWDKKTGFDLPRFLMDVVDPRDGLGDWQVMNALILKYGADAGDVIYNVMISHNLQIGTTKVLDSTLKAIQTRVYDTLGMKKPERK